MLQLGTAVRECNSYAKGRKATGFVLTIKDIAQLLRNRNGLETGRALVACLFSHCSAVRVQRRGASLYILALNEEAVHIALSPCQNLAMAVVVDTIRVCALFENSDIAFGDITEDVVAPPPTMLEARQLFKAAGVLTQEDLSTALAGGPCYGPLVAMYRSAFAKLKTQIKPFVNDSAHAVAISAQGAEKPSLLSKLWLRKQLFATDAQFIKELRLVTNTRLRYDQWPSADKYPEISAYLYKWLLNMFGICPLVFCKLLLTMVFGEGARESIMCIW